MDALKARRDVAALGKGPVMAGMLFPDIAGALSSGAQAGAASAQNQFLMKDRAARDEIAPLIPRALQGDREALNQIGTRHPDTLMKITPLLERVDAGRRAKVKEDADYITQSGMAILSASPEQQPQLYARARAEAEASGRNVSNWPTTYDPGWVKFNVDKARPFADYFKGQNEGPQAMPPPGGGMVPPATGGGGVNPDNIGNVRPVGGGPNSGFQQPASLDDGIRLAVNNVKAYPAKFNNGQPMTLMQIGARWAPVGDGANDPGQWARNVASIGGLDPNQPLDLNDPMTAAKFARGVHGAEHGANKVLPPERYAQAITGGATPPGVAQGDTAPRADASGNPLPPPAAAPGAMIGEDIDEIRRQVRAQGGDLFSRGGQLEVQNGNYVVRSIQNPRQIIRMIPIPKPKEQGTGPFTGNSVEAQALNMLIANGTLTQQQAADLAAGKSVTDPATGQIIFKTPSGIFGQAPGQAAPQPLTSPQGGAPMPSAGGPAGVPAPAAPAVTVPATPGAFPLTSPKTPDAVKKFTAEALAVNSAIDNFNAILSEAGGGTLGAFMNNPRDPKAQKINGAFNALKTALRSEAFINTGVLQPAEMSMLDDMLLAPTSVRGLLATPDAYAEMLNQIKQFVNGKMTAVQTAYGQPATGLPGSQATQPQSAAEKGRDEFNVNKIPAPARDRLKANPAEAAQFDEIFGKGAAAAVLGR